MRWMGLLLSVMLALAGVSCKPKKADKPVEVTIDSCRSFFDAMARCGMGVRKSAITRCEARWAKLDEPGRKALLDSWRSQHHEHCVKKHDTSKIPATHYCRKLADVYSTCGIPFPDSRLVSCVATWDKGGFQRTTLVSSNHDILRQTCPAHADKVGASTIFGLKGPMRLKQTVAEIRSGNEVLRFRFDEPLDLSRQKPRVYQGKPVLDELRFDIPGAMFEWFNFDFAGYRGRTLRERASKYLGGLDQLVHESKGLPANRVGFVRKTSNSKNGRTIYNGEFLVQPQPSGPTLRCHFRLEGARYAQYGKTLTRICETLVVLPPAKEMIVTRRIMLLASLGLLTVLAPRPSEAKARFMNLAETVVRSDLVAEIEVGAIAKVTHRPALDTWSYSQRVSARVLSVVKRAPTLASDETSQGITIWAEKGFICARATFKKGRYLAFLRRVGNAEFVVVNHDRGALPFTGQHVDFSFFVRAAKQQTLAQVRAAIAAKLPDRPFGPIAVTIGKANIWANQWVPGQPLQKLYISPRHNVPSWPVGLSWMVPVLVRPSLLPRTRFEAVTKAPRGEWKLSGVWRGGSFVVTALSPI